MNNDFLLLKLNRAIWVAFLEKNKIEEAINYYECYINNLQVISKNRKLKQLALEEIETSKKIFDEQILEIARNSFNERDYANAVMCYGAYFKYNQNDIEIIKYYIKSLDKIRQYDLELDLLQYLESIVSKDEKIYKFIAEVYSKQQKHQKSIEYLKKYMETCGDFIPANDYNLLGCYYNCLYSDITHNMNDAIEGMKAFEKASDMMPYTKLFAKNGTIMAGKTGNFEVGEKCWKRVLATNNITNDDKYDYAAFCLKNRKFDEWHKYFEARFDKENNATAFPKIDKPKWDGIKDISNSTLLVYFEQGFGDTFLTFGYIPRLVKSAKHVIFVVQNSIYNLLKDNEYGIEVLSQSMATDLSKLNFDYYIPSMSIPIVLKLEDKNLSVGEGYIKSDKNLVEEYKQKYFDNNKLKIGISISGNSNGDKSRDIDVNSLKPLDNLKNVQLYCITKDIPEKEFDIFKHNKVTLLGNSFDDFAKTAAAIENCDLIISTDNCILNLAGALGKKTFGLFNSVNQFRWFDLSGDDVIWFSSVKPFVNQQFNDWKPTVAKIVEEIKEN